MSYEPDNVQPAAESDKKKVIGGLADPDQIHLIDRAVLELRKQNPSLKRGPFLVDAALEKAKRVLRIQRDGDAAA